MSRLRIARIPLTAHQWTEIKLPSTGFSVALGVLLQSRVDEQIELRSDPTDEGTEDYLDANSQISIGHTSYSCAPGTSIVWASPIADKDALIVLRYIAS